MKNYLLVFLMAGLLACETEKEKNEEVDPKEIQKELSPTEVEVGLAEFKDFEYRINTSGKVEAGKEVILPFQASGLISNLTIQNGQRVNAGQILMQLENEKEELALERAKIQLENSYLGFKNDSLSRLRGNFTPEMQRYLEVERGVLTNRLNLQEAQMNYDNTFIKAPMSGIVANLEIKEGGMASAGKEFCRIYDPNSLILKAKILESDIALVKMGQEVEIYPVSKNAEAYTGRVMEINPMVDENGLVMVRIVISQSTGLMPGMNASAIIRVPQNKNLIVPKNAVVVRGGREVVFTLENGRAKWNYVVTGMDNGVEMEILEGVEAGKTVITTNNLQIGNDAAVKVVNPIPNIR